MKWKLFDVSRLASPFNGFALVCAAWTRRRYAKNRVPAGFAVRHGGARHGPIHLAILALMVAAEFAAIGQPAYYLTDLGATISAGYVNGINNSNQITGYSMSGVSTSAFLIGDGVMTYLGTLGGDSSLAAAVNNNGQVVGSANFTYRGPSHASLYSQGAMQDLGSLGGMASVAYGLNDEGQVVGASYISGNQYRHAFLYSDGVLTDLETLGGTTSMARGINSQGQVVGSSATTNGVNHAFLYDHGMMTDLGTLGGTKSGAQGINNKGEVVGYAYTSAEVSHAVLYSGGTMTDLGASRGTTSSCALAINNNGQVVGYTTEANGLNRACLFSNGMMTDLNGAITNSSWVLQTAVAINDKGWIIGNGNSPLKPNRAFLLTPTPYPYSIMFTRHSLSNGVIQTTLTGTVSGSVIIETSPDFKTWTPIQTNPLTSGSLDLAVPVTRNPSLFIRARTSP